MTRKLTLITGLSCLASALVNGTVEDLNDMDRVDYDAFVKGLAYDLGPSARVEDVARDASGEGIEPRLGRIAVASHGKEVLANVVDYVVAYDPAEAREEPEEYTGPEEEEDEPAEEEPLPGSLQGLTVAEAQAALAPVGLSAEDLKLVDEAVEAALNAGCLLIQERLGIETGDVAGMFWAGLEEDAVKAQFARYLKTERNFEDD